MTSETPTSPEVPLKLNYGRWQISVLIDASTYAVLAAGTNVAAINFLSECTMDTFHFQDAGNPHYSGNLPLTTIDGSLAHWSWGPVSRKFTHTHKDVLTDSLRDRSRLAMEKMNAVTTMMLYISRSRSVVRNGVEMQEIVYVAKAQQAHDFKSTEYDERQIMDYPYVFQYADFAGFTYKEAADEIILRAKLDQDILVKTELIRMTYFDRLKKISDPKDVQALLDSFYREAFVNAQI